ncbi:MAG: endonuclease/exonuclease/phosphatase family protein [Bdellovibrionota bacterium]
MKKFILISIGLLAGILFSDSITYAQSCSKVFYNYRELNKIKSMRFMSLNAEDYFLKVKKHLKNIEQKPNEALPISDTVEAMVDAIPELIKDTQPDLVILLEVNQVSMEYLASAKLKNQWTHFLFEGNDQRQIGFLIKEDIPVDVETRTHRDMKWKNPSNNNQEEILFTRDFPALIFRRKNEKQPFMIALGAHGHSKASRKNDPNSASLKRAEMSAMEKIIISLKKEFGENVPLILGGDFNATIKPGSEVQPLLNQLKEAFDIANVPFSRRATSYFLGKEGRRVLRQVDAIMMSPSLAPFVKQAFVYPYKINGRNGPLPMDTPPELINMIPSDHYPVVVDISTEIILPEAHGK